MTQHGVYIRLLECLITNNHQIDLIVKIFLKIQTELTRHQRRVDHVLITLIAGPKIVNTKKEDGKNWHQKDKIRKSDLGR